MAGNGRKRNGIEECAFFLIKSDVKKSSMGIANAIARIPGVEEVCFTEGKYSFLARFSVDPVDPDEMEKLQGRLEKCDGIVEVDRLNAPIVMRR